MQEQWLGLIGSIIFAGLFLYCCYNVRKAEIVANERKEEQCKPQQPEAAASAAAAYDQIDSKDVELAEEGEEAMMVIANDNERKNNNIAI